MKTKKILNVIALLMAAVMMLLSVPAGAAVAEPVQPYASAYLDAYKGTATRSGNGVVNVNFKAWGTGTLDKLGAKSIKIYQSYDSNTWSPVWTFSAGTTYGMLGTDTFYHSGDVRYSGYVGVYYKAYIQFYGEDNGSSESFYYWTNVVI